MNLTLYTGPDPQANADELFRSTSTRRGDVLAIVPDRRSSLMVERRLASREGAFLGHRVHTLESMALDIVAVDGPVPGIISSHIRQALIAEVVKHHIGPDSKYASIARYPGFIGCVSTYLEETRSRNNPKPSSDRDLNAITRSYTGHLRRLGLVDHEGLIAETLVGDRIERFAARFRGPLIIDGFYDFNDMQRALVERLITVFPRSAMTLVIDTGREELFAIPMKLRDRLLSLGARIVAVPGKDTGSATSIMAGFMGGTYPAAGLAKDAAFHSFRNNVSESDWVAGSIRAMIDKGEASPDDIMVVSRFPRVSGDPLERALDRHGVPVEDGFAKPIVTQPIIRVIMKVLEASIHPDREPCVRRVLMSTLVGDPSVKRGRLMSGFEERGWTCRMNEIDTPEGFCSNLAAILGDLGISKNSFNSPIDTLMEETAVFARFMELLGEFSSLYASFTKMMRAEEFLRLFRQFLQPVTTQSVQHKGRGVIVTDVNHARYIHREIVYITGVDDSSFPARELSFSLFDRMAESDMRKRRRAEEPLLLYMSAVGAARLVFTFPGIDDEGRDNALSPYVRELRDATAAWSPMMHHAAIPGVEWEQGVVNERGAGEHAIRALKRAKTSPDTLLHMAESAASPLLHRLLRVVESVRTRIDKKVIDLSMTPFFSRVADTVYPVTALEAYHACPIAYFFDRMLGIRIDRGTPGEIDPLLRGTIVHEVLSRFYEERRRRFGATRFTSGDIGESRAMMRELLGESFKRTVADVVDYHTVTFLAEKRYYLAWLYEFIDQEALLFEQNSFSPVTFEVSFGRNVRGDCEREGGNRNGYPALVIGEGDERALIGGRIDRIDITEGDGPLVVRIVDYKTGSMDKGLDKGEEGTQLQIPLYIRAAGELMYPEATGFDGAYYNLKEMTMKSIGVEAADNHDPDGWQTVIEQAERKALEAVTAIRNGNYPYPETVCSNRCSYYSICRGGTNND